MIYLDNNATTRPSDASVRATVDALTNRWHNPSSIHRAGQAARQAVDLARKSMADLINARPRDIVFTSGGTESINMAIRGTLAASPRRAIVTSPIEHEAVRGLCEQMHDLHGFELRIAPMTRGGVVDAAKTCELIDETVAIVSVMWANNETGAIQPVEQIGARCREVRATFHCDGTQWVGKMPTDVQKSPIDLLTFSSHKFHGPKGAGGLYIRPGVRIRPITHGNQEMLRRGGTENVPGVVGMGVAAAECAAWLADPSNRERVSNLRDHFERSILERCPESRVNAPADPDLRLWNTTNIAFPRLEAEALLLMLSERAVCASAGSACSSGSLEPSPVLCAMGVPADAAHGSLRFSLSRETTREEIDTAVEIIAGVVEKMRGMMLARA